MTKKSYITSPIYYVNDVAHIGHAYTTIICDMLKKYQELNGIESFFTTGSDEHGQKIEQSAQKNGKTPQAYADEVSAKFRALWEEFDIDFDNFIRTTDSVNCNAAKIAFAKMYQKGDIYKGEYEGWYCVSCESQFTLAQVQNQKCPDCGKQVQIIKEESYFFALSKYQDKLLKWYENCPDVINPKHKKNEVVSFVKGGLHDLSITRTSFEWGVELPEFIAKNDSKKHIMYVWLDALMSYLSAINFGVGVDCAKLDFQSLDSDKLDSENGIAGEHFKNDFWQNATHIVGKDILRFHAVYWPAFLMSLDLPLPKKIYAHGWWLNEGQKMSKSVGNVINPREMVQKYGMDAFRYFLMREVPFGQDGDFAQSVMIERINSDLANDIGNLLNRVIAMSEKYFELHMKGNANLHEDLTNDSKEDYSKEEFELHIKGDVNLHQDLTNHPKEEQEKHIEFRRKMYEVSLQIRGFKSSMQDLEIHAALGHLLKIFSIGNEIISYNEPWKLIKTDVQKTQNLLACVANILLKGALCLYPFMPLASKKIAQEALGVEINAQNYKKFVLDYEFLNELKITKIPPLFPRIEVQKSVDSKENTESKSQKEQISESSLIDIKDFAKLDLRVGEVLSCERVEKSEKLLLFKIDLGEERPRQILSGIAKFYEPASLVGKQVCVVANLKPVKLMGLLSEGMILSASDESGLSVLSVADQKANGAKIS